MHEVGLFPLPINPKAKRLNMKQHIVKSIQWDENCVCPATVQLYRVIISQRSAFHSTKPTQILLSSLSSPPARRPAFPTPEPTKC